MKLELGEVILSRCDGLICSCNPCTCRPVEILILRTVILASDTLLPKTLVVCTYQYTHEQLRHAIARNWSKFTHN